METTIIIDNKEVRFKSTAATPLRFKAQFGKDYFAEIIKLNKLSKFKADGDNYEVLENADFEIFYNIIWTLAKTADRNIPEPLTWLDGFDEFPLFEIIPQVQDLIAASIQSKKKIENDDVNGEVITTESFLLLCRKVDLYREDLEDMTIGMCLDYIEEYIKINKPANTKVRAAIQKDFDNF